MKIVAKKGVMDGDKCIIPCEFTDIKQAIVDNNFSDTIYITLKDELYGIAVIKDLNSGKVEYTQNEFDEINQFQNGVLVFGQYCERFGMKYGLINTELNEVLECIYDEIDYLSYDYVSIKKDGKYGVYSIPEKKIIVECNHKGVSWTNEDGKDKIILDV